MTPHELLEAFETLADAPDGVKRLRELVLQLAVRGKLVLQDLAEEPAIALLGRLTAEQRESQASSTNELYELPGRWVWARFDDVAEIASNLVDPRGYPNEPHVAPDNIEKATGRLMPHRTIAEDGVTSGKHKFYPGQILYSKIRPNLSKVVRVDFGGLCSADMYPINPKIDRAYLHLFMLSRPFFDQVTADENRLAMPKVNQAQLSAVSVAVPPLAEQRRIVARVDELMGLLDRLETACAVLDEVRRAARDSALAALREAEDTEAAKSAWARVSIQMDIFLNAPEDVGLLRQAILQWAVRGRLVRQDPSDEPASILLAMSEKERGSNKTKLNPVESKELDFSLPAGWSAVRVGSLVASTDAGWSPKCDSFPTNTVDQWGVLKTTAVQANRYMEEHHKALPPGLMPRPELEVAVGDLLVTRAGPSSRVGVAAHVTCTRGRLMLSDKIIRCRFSSAWCNGAWLAMAINHGPGASFLKDKQTGMDAAQVNISQDRLLQTPIPVPPLAEQHRVVARVDALMTVCDGLEARLLAARDLQEKFAAAAVHHLDV